ncbi:serine hydrolase domain-containing protein [Symbioplanes lichenis]|uniref:serine hydrolase domain-containing protein n=1 Tax=Symbioplanes lichenis TaxID=1629072 RepID=UPI002739D8F2|nr:serine hydrolase domain-containing protein [Actinoplanes lichenis]
MSEIDLLPETRRALLHRLATGQVEGRAPSVVAAILRGGRPVWTQGWGSVDGVTPGNDVQYRIGSISKTFVAVLVLRLRDAGRLALTDPLERHLPGTAAGDVTVGELLAHTSGLAAETPAPWWERSPGAVRPEIADILGADPRKHPAGRRFHYSNAGYGLLGALVGRLHGEPWFDVLRRDVLEPLGLTRTSLMPQAPHAHGWAVHPWADVLLPEPAEDAELLAPAGQLWSTIADLGRFATFLLHGDDRVLSADSVAEMREPACPPEAISWNSGYGYGTQLLRHQDRLLSGHTGSMPGFVSTVWTSPEEDLAVVVLANTTAGLSVGGLAAELLTIVADREPRIPAPWQPLPELDPELLALAGPWYWGPAPLLLKVRPGGLLELGGLRGGGRGAKLRPTGPDTWIGLSGYYHGETLRAVRDDAGQVTHLDLGSFVLTRRPYDPPAVIPGHVDPAGWRGQS